MFRWYSPGTTAASLLIAWVLSLFKAPTRKIRKPVDAYEPYVSEVQRIVDAHSDCTAEVFNIFVSGRKKVNAFSQLIPGDEVSVARDDDNIVVSVDRQPVASAELPDSSLLPEAFRQDAIVGAYFGGRDVANSSETAEFASIIVFYKLPGVPPTTVKLE